MGWVKVMNNNRTLRIHKEHNRKHTSGVIKPERLKIMNVERNIFFEKVREKRQTNEKYVQHVRRREEKERTPCEQSKECV